MNLKTNTLRHQDCYCCYIKRHYTGVAVPWNPNRGGAGGLGIQTKLDKICLYRGSLKGGSRYLNSDKSPQNLDTVVPRYPNRSGGHGIGTSSDKTCLDGKSIKGGSRYQNNWDSKVPRYPNRSGFRN